MSFHPSESRFQALNLHLRAPAQCCPRCSGALCGGLSLKTLLWQQIDEVYLERSAVKAGGQREKAPRQRESEEVTGANGFFQPGGN